jgi:hypothetical protein
MTNSSHTSCFPFWFWLIQLVDVIVPSGVTGPLTSLVKSVHLKVNESPDRGRLGNPQLFSWGTPNLPGWRIRSPSHEAGMRCHE